MATSEVRRPLARLAARAEALPLVVLGAGALVVAAVAASVGVDVQTFALDETLHQQQAVAYTDGLPAAFVNDDVARATARLYSLAVMPAFALLDGDAAVRAARAFSALLFASAAVPAHLIARRLVTSRWLAVVAALAAVALPWLALTTVLYTENLAYPLFLWTTWAIMRSLEAPGLPRDVVALTLIALATLTRAQMVFLLAAYLVLIVIREAGAHRSGLRRTLVRAARRFPATAALLAVGALAVLAVAAVGEARPLLDRSLGPYRSIAERGGIPTDLSTAVMVEVAALAVGIGILPALVGSAWVARVLRRPGDPRFWTVLSIVVVVAVLWATALFAQGRYLGAATEERYYFYAVGFLWMAALAALEDRSVSRAGVVLAAAVFAGLLAVVPLEVGLNFESQFLSPVLATVGHVGGRVNAAVGGLGTHDLLVVVTALLAAAAALTWNRARAAWVAAVALPLVVQLGLTGYVLAAARGEVPGIPPRTGDAFARLGFVDRAVRDGEDVAILRGGEVTGRELDLAFWNTSVQRVVQPPGPPLEPTPYPLEITLPSSTAAVEPSGRLVLDPLPDRLVQDPTSPFLQVAGRRIAATPELELVEPERPGRARWVAEGLESDGFFRLPVRLLVTPPAGARAAAVTFVFEPLPDAATSLRLQLGDTDRVVELPAKPGTDPVRVEVTACGTQEGVLETRATALGPQARQVSARLLAVQVRAAPAERCGSRARTSSSRSRGRPPSAASVPK